MLLFYVDESGDDAPFTDDPESRKHSDYFALAAVGIRDTSRVKLAQALSEFKSKYLGAREDWAGTEIKGSYLRAAVNSDNWNGRRPPEAWSQAVAAGKAPEMTRYLEQMLLRFRPLIYVAVIDKAVLLAQGNRVTPLGAAYALVYERVSQMLTASVEGESAVFIADQQAKHEKQFRDGELSKARAAMAERLPSPPAYERVLDKPLWIDTNLSVLDREVLQVADLAAYSARTVVERKTGSLPQEYLWPAIHDCLARNWHGGGVMNGGLIVHPKSGYFDPNPQFPLST